MTTEKREFRMHRDILWSIIKSQAGTIGKALMELVMNSIDANASKIDIKLNQSHVSVSDNGKGFRSREEIEMWFETFGTPHQKGDATYGRFRMGRGQIMAFTRNEWRSGNFAMRVDIRDLGLAYHLETVSSTFSGCEIKGEFYDSLKPSEVIRLVDELRSLCCYSPVPVFVNGEDIASGIAREKWTFEDEDAYYLLRQNCTSLEVYNLGVLVRHYTASEYGIGGVIVSKKQLEVNFARNDILVKECEVWKRVSSKVKETARKSETRKKNVQNEHYRTLMTRRILSGGFDTAGEFLESISEAKIFTDYIGSHMTLDKLNRAVLNANATLTEAIDPSLKADKVHQMKMAVVLSPDNYVRSNRLSFDEVAKKIIKNIDGFLSTGAEHSFELKRVQRTLLQILSQIKPLDSLTSSISENHHPVTEKDLTTNERIILKILNKASNGFAYSINDSWNGRVIKACESETALAYTDGSSVIFFDRKLLKISASITEIFSAFERLKMVMIHEYLHNADDSSGHEHDADFYKRYHDTCLSKHGHLMHFTLNSVRQYIEEKKKSGAKISTGELATLDLVVTQVEEDATT